MTSPVRWLALALLASSQGCAHHAKPATPPFADVAGCAAPEHHQLDFWLGEWTVSDAQGKPQGTNVITPALGHCAIEERWTDVERHQGASTFFYDRAAKVLRQVWVTDAGTWKEKSQRDGAPTGAIRFHGDVPMAAGGSALDRTTLTPLGDGRVRQVIERSKDGGATWTSWEGIYTRKHAATPPPAEARQFDFWIGQWDVAISARPSPDSEQWAEGKGINEVTSVLGGHGVAEHFVADGPQMPWAGTSLSIFSAGEGKWRQTWIDDSGGYLAFVGGMKNGEMILEGEPRTRGGATTRMRMVFSEISPRRILWRWEQTADDGQSWRPVMKIVYTRRAGN